MSDARYSKATQKQKEYVIKYRGGRSFSLFCEELATVGVQGFDETISENSIRKEHGFKKRLNYHEGKGVE